MNWTELLSTLIFAAWPVIFVVTFNIAGTPERQRKALAQFAPMAVQQIEQQSKGLSNVSKKQLAMASVAKSFKASKLPPLPEDIVSAAIEAAVLLLPNSQPAPSE